MFKRKKFWKRIVAVIVIIPVVLTTILVGILYYNQDKIVQHFIETANKDFKGVIKLNDSHIAPFANFPYISIDLERFELFENKDAKLPIIHLKDLYLGFDFWTLVNGEFDISLVKLNEGYVHAYQDENGEFDILKAFETNKEIHDVEEEFHFNLKQLEFSNIEVSKTNADSLAISGFIRESKVNFSNQKEDLFFGIEMDANISIVKDKDTSFLKKKDLLIDANLDYKKLTDHLTIEPSKIEIMNSIFNFNGDIDVLNNFDLDLNIQGKKSDFSLLIALSPDDLIPLFNSFENKGDVFFKSKIKGPSVNGNIPKITADFGCENGFFRNPTTDKTLEELNFVGHFQNDLNGGPETMRLSINDFTAKPETGIFDVNLSVVNFDSPDIDLKLKTLFELDYLAQFLEVEDLQELKGHVELEMNFHDVIDLNQPEKSIEKLNESYYTRLDVDDLSFIIPGYDEKFENINVDLHMDGHKAILDQFSIKVGHSDVTIDGTISDLPAILHHTNIPVIAKLNVKSNEIDINQLTSAKGENVVDEDIRDLSMKLEFHSSARAMTESPYLPIGEFFVKDFYADMTTYPHRLHDFHTDILIDSTNLSIVDFTGMIDKSDFHFTGKVEKYPMWFQEKLDGDTKIEYDLTSNLFQLEDIFSYQGENFVPEDYRHEEFSNMKFHGYVLLHFEDEKLVTTDISLTEVRGKMKIHPLAFKNFKGRVHIEDEHLTMEKFKGQLGKSSFSTNLSYYFGDKAGLKENYLEFNAPYLDFDALFSYETSANENTDSQTVEHDSVFSVFDVPFPNMRYHIDIGKMNYHKYRITNINSDLRTTNDHMLYIDTLQMDIADGHMDIGGYFNGADRTQIYFSPIIGINNVDLDQLMVKFDNFGQDEIVSDNIHGRVTGKLWGKIHMHADLVPIIDDSEIHMDMEVTGGSVENYAPLNALSGYFEDDQLHKVIFDTLQNHVDMTNGEMTIPEMVINTNLGFLKVSGRQDMDMNMEYYVSVPWKMITKAGGNKLFGNKSKDTNEIGEYDPDKKYRFVNIIIKGDADDYSVSLGKKKN
ncbi:MAG: AsmA-like C-terminal region-containing protein [Brumimicrobium sp.]